jgi:hypothetical protein
LSLFAANSVQANKDAIINDINNIAANAYQFYIRPVSMAGGGSAYDMSKGATKAYTIPARMATNDNATYSVATAPTTVTITGLSKTYTSPQGTIVATVSNLGVVVFTLPFAAPFD